MTTASLPNVVEEIQTRHTLSQFRFNNYNIFIPLPEIKVVLLQALIAGMYQRACSLGFPPFLSQFSL